MSTPTIASRFVPTKLRIFIFILKKGKKGKKKDKNLTATVIVRFIGESHWPVGDTILILSVECEMT